jgi:DNA-binding transcriptional MerR regulator
VGDRMTITDVAKKVGVTPKTIMRWEKARKINKAKRNWRGWRIYEKEDIEEILRLRNHIYYV